MEIEKYKLYKEFVELVMQSVRMGRDLKPNAKKTQASGESLQSLGLRMMIISSNEVVHGYLRWRAIAMEGSDSEAVFKAFAEIIIKMREELVCKGVIQDTDKTIDDVLDILT